MSEVARRGFVLGAASLATGLLSSVARATLVRGLTLSVLVKRSERIVVLEPLEATCTYAEIGGRKSIVTDTLVRLHETWADPGESQLVLRTLGGQLDGVGELVHGQAVLELGVPGVAFLKRGRDRAVWWAVGMAQGHFPLSGASETSVLLAGRNLPAIVELESSAVRRLVGRQLRQARELVREARQP